MSNTNHTPTPWSYNAHGGIYTFVPTHPVEYRIVDHVRGRTEDELKANAAHIVKCVNAHDELVAALTEMETLLEMCAAGEAPSPESEEYYTQRITQVRAALAKVKS